MEKQDLQAGESQWQNSNYTTSQIQEQKTQRHESGKMALNQAQDKKHFRVAINYDQLVDIHHTQN